MLSVYTHRMATEIVKTINKHESSRLFAPERLVPERRSTLSHCTVGLDIRPAIPTCLLQLFQATPTCGLPRRCMLSIGCRTDRRHD